MKFNLNSKQRGIGLLELMLSLAIIALLLIMATRYYSQAHGSEQVNSAVNSIHAVYAAAESAVADAPNSGSTMSLSSLVDAGLLPSIYGSQGQSVNPWHGTITATYTAPNGSGSLGKITIAMAGIPKSACKAIGQSLVQTLSGADTVNGSTYSASTAVTGCSDTSNTITVVYNN